ncbi:MAG: glycosyltransferase family 2 protein [Patescibacteria group bacterium]
MKILIIVPAYNEEKTLPAVIKDLESHGYKNIVVIDDGSTDKSSRIAKQTKVPVLTHVLNRGLGAALGTGFEYAQKVNADIVVTFDSDGQHKAEDIKKLIAPLITGKADVVIGSRMLNYQKMPKDRLIFNFLANVATALTFGVWSTDSQSGLRVFNRKAVNSIHLKTDRMEVSSEFFKEIKRNKLNFAEVPIDPVYDEYSRKKGQEGKGNWNSVNVGIKMLLRVFR